MKTLTSLSLASALYAITSSAAVRFSPRGNDDIRFQIAVPESSADSGSGNIYFQMTAPDSYQWVALGTGRAMLGTNIFLMYQDGNGNITLSPRAANAFERPPVAEDGAELELLAGSGVSSGRITANVVCRNCESWNNGRGSMDFSSDSTNWVAAWRRGDAIDSTSIDYQIEVHNDATGIEVDLTRATVDSDTNPFLDDNGDSEDSEDSLSESENGGSSEGVSEQSDGPSRSLLAAHGIVMMIAFVIMYPLGTILMPLLGRWKIHASWQLLAFLAMWAGFGLGVVAANERDLLFNISHTILGTVVVVLFVIQPILGIAHHRYYKTHQRRGIISHGHIWFGRIIMAVAIVNGGIGLRIAGSSTAFVITYAVLAGIMGFAYAASLAWKSWRQRRRSKEGVRSPPPPVQDARK